MSQNSCNGSNEVQQSTTSSSSSMFAMIDLISGANKSCLIYCASKLNIVDHLFENEMTADQLAAITETRPDMLYRFLRALASMGVLSENVQKQFSVTDLGLTLKSGIKGGVKNLALAMLGSSYVAGGHMLHTIRTGTTAFDYVYGMKYFDYLKANQEEGEIFTNFMKDCKDILDTSQLVSGYDYTAFKHIIDIGGGIGDFLINILEHTPNAKGTVFDVDYVVEQAKQEIAKYSNVKDRCMVVAGSFLEFVPSGGDCYIAKGVLHDWSDDEVLKILANIRNVLMNGAKLLVMEALLPEGNEANPYKISDMYIATVLSGRKRTEKEFLQLFTKASLNVNKISKVKPCEVVIIELEPL